VKSSGLGDEVSDNIAACTSYLVLLLSHSSLVAGQKFFVNFVLVIVSTFMLIKWLAGGIIHIN
jgi:tetrahydromethanopterin S-methyltransferase subunit E